MLWVATMVLGLVVIVAVHHGAQALASRGLRAGMRWFVFREDRPAATWRRILALAAGSLASLVLASAIEFAVRIEEGVARDRVFVAETIA